MAFLDRPEKIDARGDPVITLPEAIRAHAIRTKTHTYLRVLCARLAAERAKVAALTEQLARKDTP